MKKEIKFDARRVTRIAIAAALYVVLTVLIAPLSYGSIQLRFSEIMILLCFYNRDYGIALTLGCAVANLFSPTALLDVPLGTLATLLAVLPMYRMKNLWLASLLPTLTNGLIVGLELTLMYQLPFLLTAASVAAGELIVVTIIGVPLFKYVLTRNSAIIRIAELRKT